MAKAELLKSIMIGLKHENNPREQPIFFFLFSSEKFSAYCSLKSSGYDRKICFNSLLVHVHFWKQKCLKPHNRYYQRTAWRKTEGGWFHSLFTIWHDHCSQVLLEKKQWYLPIKRNKSLMPEELQVQKICFMSVDHFWILRGFFLFSHVNIKFLSSLHA